ncbi:MAG TPA: hypothetical protein VHB21_08845 [Minicystis sp.]|nr:hypothetical protein [Minicystis sp.]
MGLETFRNGHGNGRGSPRVETPLEEVVPVHDPEEVPARRERDEQGRFLKGARHAQSRGGLAKRDMTAIAAELGIAKLLASPTFAPFADDIRSFVRAQRMRLSARVGGGECGPGPTKAIVAAALQDAAGRAAMLAGDVSAGSKLLADATQTLAKAYAMASLEAKHAPKATDPIGALRARLGMEGSKR